MNIFTHICTRRVYITLISIIGWAIILFHLPDFSTFHQPDLWLFLVLCIVASNVAIEFQSGMRMTLTSPVTIFLLLAVDLNTTLFISTIGMISYQALQSRDSERFFFNIAQLSLSLTTTGIFLYTFYNGTVRLPQDFVTIVPAILIFEFVNLSLVSIAIALRNKEPLKEVYISGLKESQVGMPLYLANGLIMYICYKAYGMWGLVLVIIPLFSVIWLLQAAKSAHQHKHDAHICPTTLLKNKRCLNEWILCHFQNTIRTDHTISFILIDIDDFKRINDNYGHETGDQVLTEFGQLVQNNIRDTDLIYRYGGEEFVVILPGFPEDRADHVIERLHNVLKDYSFCGELDLKITFSAGIASLDQALLNDSNMNTADELIRRADMAMYSAKQSGKNQTRFYKH